jgi:hypothetical protein
VLGIPIPDAGPVFLVALAIHVMAGLSCVISGATAALARKGGPRHVAAGRIYVWGLVVVAATMTVMAALRWQEDRHLFFIGLVSLAAGLAGYVNRRRHRTDPVHIAGMGLSYVALLTAFYVDNGPNLPVWNLLPDWSFWVLPSAIGLPLITRAIARRAGDPELQARRRAR